MKISGRNAIEFVEYMFLLVKRNTYSMIGDGDSHCFPRLAALNHNLCFLFRIFHGIVYQVTDDIAEMSADTITQYDILFLDIDLGKESGIDLARKMRKMNPEAVLIFVTNFSEYAPEGYEVDAFRYLAKSELEKKLPTYFEDALAMCRTRQRKVEILCEGESVPIPVQSLAWIESHGREQYLHLVGGCREQLITRLTMTQLEDLLVPHGFLRIHKSYLVNMAYLQSFQSTSAVLTVGQTLPVGARSYRDNKQKFVKWQAQQLW